MSAAASALASLRRSLAGIVLVAPLLLFLIVNFLAPIALLLSRAVRDEELATAWPRTAAELHRLERGTLPDAPLVATFASELMASRHSGQLSLVANRLNYDRSGYRSLLFRTARRLGNFDADGHDVELRDLVRIDERWGDPNTWAVMQHAAGPLTSFYVLAALDRRLAANGDIVSLPQQQRLFADVFVRTFTVGASAALLCLLLGYPLAYLLASLPERTAQALLVLVLLPFWTSILVRTTAWTVLLQSHGVINDVLLSLRVFTKPLELIYNRTGVLIAMTHVLLPYLVLPLYGVMKRIPKQTTNAALSLGASPWRAFRSVYVPQTIAGVAAGCLMVFILALGYYITPALVGGAGDEMIAQFIAFYVNQTLNWGMAAALSVVLLAATLGLYFVYSMFSGGNRMQWNAP